MSNYKAKMTLLADAIRSKSNISNKLTIENMISAINNISAEVGVQFYLCADVVQGAAGAQYYEVSGATAFPDCNGKYYLTDIISPIDGVAPVWKHETKTMYLFGAYAVVQITPDYSGDSGNLYHAYNYTGGTFPATGWSDVDEVDFGLKVTLKTSAPTEKTWSGYKAVWSDADGYIFEETATDGLEYGTGFTPAVGSIYNSDATITVAKLFEKTKPITYNDTSCLIYIDGTSVSNQALAPNKHEVTFGSGVTASDGYLQIPNTEDGRIKTTSKYDGFGGTLKQWTWDYYFIADGTYLSISGRSNEYWCIECHNGEGTYLYFRGQNTSTKRLPVTYTKNELIGLSMQWDDGVLHVWNKGTYIGQCAPTFLASEGVDLGINTDTGGGRVEYMPDKIKLFRFSNKARYTPGVDFELPAGFVE